MFRLFAFEAEAYPDLSRLPLHVRMKLDMSGVKFSLRDWLSLSIEERRVLCHLPAESADEADVFRSYIDFLCRRNRGEPAQRLPPVSPSRWDTPGRVPGEVLERSAGCGAAVTPSEWNRWLSHERYALYKTALSSSEPENFRGVLEDLRNHAPERASHAGR